MNTIFTMVAVTSCAALLNGNIDSSNFPTGGLIIPTVNEIYGEYVIDEDENVTDVVPLVPDGYDGCETEYEDISEEEYWEYFESEIVTIDEYYEEEITVIENY